MSERPDLLSLLAQLPAKRVLCVGDVMLDHFRYGTVERISPEAPIPVLRLEREETMLGGAGNVVRNLVSLGAGARFVTVVGEDHAGAEIARLIAEQGVADVPLVDDGRRTTTKTRFIAGTQQVLRADREPEGAVAAATRREIAAAAATALPDCAAMVLSDYGKGVLDGDTVGALIAAAGAAGKKVVVDPKGADYGRYRGADLVAPNRRELAEATRMPTGNGGDIAVAARHLIDECGFAAVLVTLGRDGMALFDAAGGAVYLAAKARDVFDVSGAGDTVVATIAAALGAGADLVRAAALANVAAGVVVGKVGTAAADAADVREALRQQNLSAAEAKVTAEADGRDRVERWRGQGLKVGFTNGCFDLLHPGHVSLLTQAKGACDRLVVGLNSDTSAAALKGPGRPVQPEAARAQVLASLEMVDMVVIFAAETPIALIESLRPDVLVKGADYKIDDVVGAEVVRGYGGRVLLATLEEGHSTTATIARMARHSA